MGKICPVRKINPQTSEVCVQKRDRLISFGTTQERKTFPYSYAPDRLGIEVLGVRGNPSLGPGSYLGPESSLSTRPMSTLGYVMGARTAPRFQQKAQQKTGGKQEKAAKKRGESRKKTGEKQQNKTMGKATKILPSPKVSWPSRFGAPDWAALPQLAPRMVKMQVQKVRKAPRLRDREFPFLLHIFNGLFSYPAPGTGNFLFTSHFHRFIVRSSF
uniref:Uncharacterized protein n=1 Tax=Geospiza parvula TaxID=87175 RepID=A0A8C3MB36_GEOPR